MGGAWAARRSALLLLLLVLGAGPAAPRPGAAELEYERAVPACGAPGAGCEGARRHELDEEALDVLAAIETDADCAGEPPPPGALRRPPGPLGPPGAPGRTVLATCALPAALAFEVFAVVAAQRARCGSAAAGPGHAGCDHSQAFSELASLLAAFRAVAAGTSAALAARGEVELRVRRLVSEEADRSARAVAELWTPEAAAAWRDDPAAAGRSALRVCERLGLGRRILFWRANLLQSVADFGLATFLPLVAPRGEFFNSRMEVLSELLGGPWWPTEVRFVEIGVHLARLAFVLLSQHRRLHYIGVDPFEYDRLTAPDSAARQLGDLGLADASELRGEVRQGAEAKLSLFPGRAELLALPSVEAAASVPDASLDGVFVDGDHTYHQVARDLAAWEPKVRPGGFLSGHDFGNHPDVARAVLERAAAGNRTVHLAMDWVWYWRV